MSDPSLFQTALDSLVEGGKWGAVSQGLRWDSFLASWGGFADARLMFRLVVGLLMAVLLTALIAYHPRTRRAGSNPDEIAYPRTLFIYGIVGAMVAEAVVIHPPIAFVVFGIGGLLRFRTNVGAAADTGQLILVTIIGIACGLHEFPLAVLGTVMGWILLFVLQRKITYIVDVHGVEKDRFRETVQDGREAVEAEGCSVVHVKNRPSKNRITYVVLAPFGSSDGSIQERVEHRLGPEVEVEVERS